MEWSTLAVEDAPSGVEHEHEDRARLLRLQDQVEELQRTRVAFHRDGSLVAPSPCPIDAALKAELEGIGPVKHIVAPGTYHYFHVAEWQAAFPEATTWICPGVERKLPGLRFDWLLGDRSPQVWEDEIDQVLVRGTRFIVEIAFFHRVSRTLVLTDLVENIGDGSPGGSDRLLRFWWKSVFRMWNRPPPGCITC